MIAIALIVFRETLEAALFISIIAAATRGVLGRGKWLTAGVLAGGAGSLAIAAVAGEISELAEGLGQDLVNAGILAIAFMMLAWHIIWGTRHGMHAAGEARQLGRSMSEGSGTQWAVAIAIAMSVLREGAETVLFVAGYIAGNGSSTMADAISGCLVGVSSGAAVGVVLYLGLSRIPIRQLFGVTNTLVLLLAAAMAAQFARTLIQAGILTNLTEPVWDISHVLPTDSAIGSVLHALIGYDAQPSGMQLLFYVSGLLLITFGMWLTKPNPRNAVAGTRSTARS